jgi:hypothetical protein
MMLETIFNPEELICLGKGLFDTESIELSKALATTSDRPFFCINPLNGKRKDSNVTVYRNFLIEFDTMCLEEQLRLIKDSGLPHTSRTFSGKKSYHFIVSLVAPLASEKEWREIARWLFKVFPAADTKAGNPSRFSRTPGAIRPDTGLKQELIELRTRIHNEDLISWLESKVEKPKPFRTPISDLKPGRLTSRRLFTLRTREFLRNGAPPGHHNQELFIAACNLTECGYPIDAIIRMTQGIEHNDDESTWIKTIESAVSKVTQI